jgi:glycosyltransferase involved in cell wall biosynthesis
MKSISNVSVIIPCYNAADVIERALDSVLAQSVLPNEIILIDDASNDGTSSELSRLKGLHHDVAITVITNKSNLGPGFSRNEGWSRASSEWIAFLDADDAWDPNKLEEQLKLADKNPDFGIFCHESKLAENRVDQGLIGLRDTQTSLSIKSMMFKNSVSTRTVLLRRDLPQRFSRGLAEDLSLWLACLIDGISILKSNSPHAYIYRPEFSPGGISSNLVKHEFYELKVLGKYFKLMPFTTSLALIFSLGKFIRRCLIRVLRRISN